MKTKLGILVNKFIARIVENKNPDRIKRRLRRRLRRQKKEQRKIIDSNPERFNILANNNELLKRLIEKESIQKP